MVMPVSSAAAISVRRILVCHAVRRDHRGPGVVVGFAAGHVSYGSWPDPQRHTARTGTGPPRTVRSPVRRSPSVGRRRRATGALAWAGSGGDARLTAGPITRG